MHCEEKWIEGVLHIRVHPQAGWRAAPAVYLNRRLWELNQLLAAEIEQRTDDRLDVARAMHEERQRLFFRTGDSMLEVAP